MSETVRREILPYVFLTHRETDKFKTGSMSINLLTQLTRSQAAKNAILPRLLLRGTKGYPDLGALNRAMDNLYGAKVIPLIRKKGEVHCIGLYGSFVDEACLPPGEGILEPFAAFLGEILLDPLLEKGRFREEYVESERENLLDEIRGRINDKVHYSIVRLLELMCDGEDFSVFYLGTEQEAMDIRPADLTEHYHKILSESPIEIFYSGTASPDQVEAVLCKALKHLPRGEPDFNIGTDVRLNSVGAKPRYFNEEMDVNQGKLTLGFRLGDAMEDPDYPALWLLHYLYGGSVNSKLFLNVRERLSLCYYASSILEKAKGLLLVASGIAFDKYDQALGEILAQLTAIQKGDVTEEEFSWAKSALVTDLRMFRDDPHQMEDFYLQQTILGLDYGLEELIAKVEETSKERVIETSAALQLDAVYFLKGSTEEEVAP